MRIFTRIFISIIFFINFISIFSWGGDLIMQNRGIDLVSRLHLDATAKIVIEPLSFNENKNDKMIEINNEKEINLILNALRDIEEKTLIDSLCNYKMTFYNSENQKIIELEFKYDLDYPAAWFFRNRNVNPYEDYFVDRELVNLLNSKLK